MKEIFTPEQTEIAVVGPDLKKGPLPAFFYFSLSAQESLSLDPYNQPVTPLAKLPIRIYSFTLPSHGEGCDNRRAMEAWSRSMTKGETPLEECLTSISKGIGWLIDQGWVDSHKMAVGGLSRGAFIASHVAIRDPRIKTLLGFAPLTKLSQVREFASIESKAAPWDLHQHLDKLLHLHHLRFYMGLRDTRVHTDACYDLIRSLVELAHEKRKRSFFAELFLTHSIGHMGHGTSPQVFLEGAKWIQEQLEV